MAGEAPAAGEHRTMFIGDDGDAELLDSAGDMTWVGDDAAAAAADAETVRLACPEGDTFMRVAKAEAGSPYLCPKHLKTLEQVKGRERKVIKIRRTAETGDEAH